VGVAHLHELQNGRLLLQTVTVERYGCRVRQIHLWDYQSRTLGKGPLPYKICNSWRCATPIYRGHGGWSFPSLL